MTKYHPTMQRLYDETDKKPSEIADDLNTSPQNVNNWNKRGISKGAAIDAAKFYNLNVEWLLTGEGTAITGDKSQKDPKEDKPTKAKQPSEWDNSVSPVSNSQLRRAPIINWVQAGVFPEIADSCYDEWEYFVDKGFSDTVYWLRVQGDSMSPEFKEGELLLVDQDRQPKAGDYVIALECDQDRATFKKYKPNCYDENQGIEYAQLIALNPFYPPLDSRAKPFKVMGVVVMHKRSLV